MSGDTPLPRAASRVVFVVGKGGVGKTTTAATLARSLSESGRRTYLISTDPAHSLHDFFGSAREPLAHLTIEEFSARDYADQFFQRLRAPFIELLERGTYLDAEDAAGFLDLSAPGIDEVMAALRIVELYESDAEHIIVDTAPTGHTLRLLDAPRIIEAWVNAGRAMAEKAGVVAAHLVGRTVRLQAEALLDEWQRKAERFRTAVLRDASAIVVTRAGHVVEAETTRLQDELRKRGLNVSQTIVVAHHGATLRPAHRPPIVLDEARTLRQVYVAGKGGVGKSTCAAALALHLAESRRVCLVSTDPAGSLSEVLAVPVDAEGTSVAPNLVALQIDALAEFNRMRDQYRATVDSLFASIGLDTAAQLDRRVIESLFDFAPPGIDEIISLVEILERTEQYDTIVVDTAPTGHFLRLIELPAIALDWVHALLRLLVKYRAVSSLDALAHQLLAFAKRLRQLKMDLSTPGTSTVFIVTLAEPMVQAETARLISALQRAHVPIAATILNRADDGSHRDAFAGGRSIRAPDMGAEVVGPASLRSFFANWEFVGE